MKKGLKKRGIFRGNYRKRGYGGGNQRITLDKI